MIYSTDRFKAVAPVLILLFVALWIILRGDLFKSCLVLFCSCVFRPFSIAITSLGEERANLSVLCFSYVCSISACLVLSVSSSSWCLGRAAACDCGTPWIFLLTFFVNLQKVFQIHSTLVVSKSKRPEYLGLYKFDIKGVVM